MEAKNRNVWIIVVAVVLVIMCCCALAGAAAAMRWVTDFPFDLDSGLGFGQERIEETFEVGSAPTLEVDNFAGSLTVHPGERGEIRVVAIKQGPPAMNLDRIEIQMSEQGGGLVIKTRKPSGLGSGSVRFEIVAPADTYLDLHTGAGSVDVGGFDNSAKIHSGAGSLTLRDLEGDVKADTGAGSVTAQNLRGEVDLHSGAGSVEVRDAAGSLKVDTGSGRILVEDMTGEIDAHSGTGSMEVREVEGPARLDTGSGSITYNGTPLGDCRFKTGTGSINLRLPAALDAEVDLHTGVGAIEVEFPVAGEISKRDIKGAIGSGGEVSIYAHTGSGSIDMLRR